MKSIIEKGSATQCFLCGAWGPLEKHHIFGGNPNRKWSEKYGLTVHLCRRCHRDNKKGVHADAESARRLHQIGQEEFEKKYSRQKFYDIFKHYYIDEEDGEEAKEEADAMPGICMLTEEGLDGDIIG